MKVFVSHIHEEREIAILLKTWIEDSFLGQIDVFVSSDADDIPAGARWLEKINTALNDSKLFLVIVSPTSLLRPWINFETGCSWIKGVPVIPICHSGLTETELSSPPSQFQALNADGGDFPKALLTAIAKYHGIQKIPQLDFSAMANALSEVLSMNATTKSERLIEDASIQSSTQLNDEEVKILVLMCNNGGANSLVARQISQLTGVHVERVNFHLANLEKGGFVYGAHFYTERDSEYQLDHSGRQFLIENGHI